MKTLCKSTIVSALVQPKELLVTAPGCYDYEGSNSPSSDIRAGPLNVTDRLSLQKSQL